MTAPRPDVGCRAARSRPLAMARGWSRIWNAPLPVIAQIHGHCLAGGTDLALHCDLVITAEDATIGFPALRMGGTPPTNMWLYHVGVAMVETAAVHRRHLHRPHGREDRLRAGGGARRRCSTRMCWRWRTRIAAMGRDIVAINKHVLNRGIDLMGRAACCRRSRRRWMRSPIRRRKWRPSRRGRRKSALRPPSRSATQPFAEGVPLDCADDDL